MENHLKDEFVSLYHKTVKPIALKCAEGFHVMKQAQEGKEIKVEDIGYFEKIKESVDSNAIWFIGHMIGDIEKALIGGIRLNTINSISQVHGCLTSADYWTNVWNNDYSSEEAKNLKELGEEMNNLIKLL